MSGGASAVEQNSARVHGSKVNCVTSLDLNLNSPRSVEARTRCSMDERNFTTQSGDLSGRYRRKRGRLKAQGAKEHPAKTAIRTERNEINRHHLLREVRKERAKWIEERRDERKNTDDQRLLSSSSPAATSLKQAQSHDSSRETGTSRRMSTLAPMHTTDGAARKSPRSGNPVLEKETQRLVTLKRRQAMELQQMLAFELRSLAREERDRRRVEKSTAREEAAEARKAQQLQAAEQARIDRERFALDRGKQLEQEAANARWRHEKATRQLEAADELRRRKSAWAAQRRAEDAKQKATVLESRIARGARVRRARELRNERNAARRAAERDAAVESAKRVREAEAETRKAAAVERGKVARAAVEEARRRQDYDEKTLRGATEGKVAELEARAESFRRRRKEIWERERVLHEEELAELEQRRHNTATCKMEEKARRREAELHDKARKEAQVALALQVRKEKKAAKRQEQKLEKEAQMKRALDRRKQAEQQRQEATIRKLEEDAAKVELLRKEKERLKLTRSKMCGETAKQRESLKEHFGALRNQLVDWVSFDTIIEAVATAAQPTNEDSSVSKKSQHNGRIRRPHSSKITRGGEEYSSPRVRAPQKTGAVDGFSSNHTSSSGVQRHRKARPISWAGDTRRVITRSTSIAGKGGDVSEISLRVPHPPAASSPSQEMPSVDFASNSVFPPQHVSNTAKRSNTSPRGHEASFGGAVDGESHYNDGDQDSATGSKPNTQKSVDKKKIDPLAVVRRCYINPSFSSRIFTESVGKRGGIQGGSRTLQKQTRAKALRMTGSNGPPPRQKIAENVREHPGEEGMSDPSAGSKAVLQDDDFPQRCEDCLSSLDHDLSGKRLRERYDRELLAILEEEQAAEGARESALAEVRARARLAGAKARAAASSNIKLTNSSSDLSNDAHIETGGGGSNDITSRRENGSSACLHISEEGIDDLQQEADLTTQEAKNLEEQLARERRAASERVMRVSEVYEDALRALAQPYHVLSQ